MLHISNIFCRIGPRFWVWVMVWVRGWVVGVVEWVVFLAVLLQFLGELPKMSIVSVHWVLWVFVWVKKNTHTHTHTPTTHPPQTQWRIKKTWWRISFRFSFNILYQVFRIILSPKADWKDTDHIVSKAERMKKDNALHCIGATRNSSIWVAIVRTLDTRWTMSRSHVSEWWCQRKDYDI